jgi:hypothetical protein
MPYQLSPTQLCEQQLFLIFYVYLPAWNCSEQTVDIVNPPDNFRLFSDQAHVSLGRSIVDNNAVELVLEIVGGVLEHVPGTLSL